jgi:tagatose-6-phosphate ketose/aldose isomerase
MANPGQVTHQEILQQPDTWSDTVRRVLESGIRAGRAPVIAGAGSSAHASTAIEAAWRGSRAVPTTELMLDLCEFVYAGGVLISVSRSGNSPESVAVIARAQRLLPDVRHIVLTCSKEGKLAGWPGVESIVLDERTNDRALAMTSSFSNLALAGITLARPADTQRALPILCGGWQKGFEEMEEKARALAKNPPLRAVALASAPMFGAAREACLKLVELTAGHITPTVDSYLGLRHGPMSFVQADTLVLCFLSSDVSRRRYELDLVRELRAKKLGKLIGMGVPDAEEGLFDEIVTTAASSLPDYLRTPAEIVFPQLLAYHLGLTLGLDPDNPSPGGVINRVVQGVRIYD